MNAFSFPLEKVLSNTSFDSAIETEAHLSNNMVKMFNTLKEYDIVLNYVYP
jgi:predicted HAD superfamily phosphohydrolase